MPKYRLRFTRLQGTNVCSYLKFDIPLSEQGTVLLTGVNGAGKSTPWYALTWILYATTSKGLKYKDLINIHDPRNFWVRVDFELDGVPYAIETYRDHELLGTGYTIWRQGNDITPQGIDNAKALIPEIIDMNEQNFLSSVFLSQESTHVLMEGKPAQRRDHVMWTFGLSVYKDLIDGAKKKLDAEKDEVSDVDRLGEELEDIKNQLKELPTLTLARKEFEDGQAEQVRLKEEVKIFEGRRTKLARKVSQVEIRDGLVDELRELNVDGTPTATDVADLQQQVERYANKIAEVKEKLDRATKAEELREELGNYQGLPPIKKLRSDLEAVRSRKMMLNNVTLPGAQEAHSLRKKLNKIKRDDDPEVVGQRELELQAKIQRLEEKLKHVRQHLKKGTCPTCKRPWKTSPEEVKRLKREGSDLRAELDSTNKKYYVAHARAKDARERQRLEAALSKLPKEDPQDIEIEIANLARDERELRGDLTLAENREDVQNQLQNAPKENVEMLTELLRGFRVDAKAARDIARRTSKAHDLLRRISKLPSGDLHALEAKLLKAERILKRDRKQLEDLAANLARHETRVEKVKRLTKQLDEKQVRLKRARVALRDVKIWEALQKGFKHILQTRERKLLKRISTELPAYMTPLFGKQSEWVKAELSRAKQGVGMQIRSADKVLPPKGPSPGQRAKLGLALLFAMRDLYATGNSNLLILDEPLWRIDEESRPAFMEIIEDIQKRVETLVITTHETEIKGHTFDHRWHATIQDGVSSLSIGE
jgi:DNA repair exonuclease SbcCD ATPase subunit